MKIDYNEIIRIIDELCQNLPINDCNGHSRDRLISLKKEAEKLSQKLSEETFKPKCS